MWAPFASGSKRAPILAAAAALAWLAPGVAQACDVVVVPTSSSLHLQYDPFAFTRTAGRLLVDVESRESEPCSAELMLLDASRKSIAETDIGGSGVRVMLSAGAGDAALVPTAAPGVWRVTLEPGRRTKLSIDAVVVREAVATAGDHVTELLLEMRGAQASAARTAPIPIRLLLSAAPRAQMNIVGANATFGQGTRITQVDFGEMVTGAVRRVFLQVRANTSARLTIVSANRGRLLRADASAGEVGVPYGALLFDQPVDLTRSWETMTEPPKSIAGASIPFDLVLGPVGSRAAGTYSDVLTLELSAI